jgi:hypothetical protein
LEKQEFTVNIVTWFPAAMIAMLISVDALAATNHEPDITAIENSCKKLGGSPQLCGGIIADLKRRTVGRKANPTTGNPPAHAAAAAPEPSGLQGKSHDYLPTLSNAPGISAEIKSWGCAPADKALFVRSDPLDNFNYLVTLDPTTSGDSDTSDSSQSPNSKTKGLSVSYTDNIKATTEAATINGRVSYLLFGIKDCSLGAPVRTITETGEQIPDDRYPHWSGFGFAPFISSNGSWNEPLTAQTTGTTAAGKTIIITTAKTSNSALRFGGDFQGYAITPRWPIAQHFFYISPFYQTDYNELARIGGIDLIYEPTIDYLKVNETYIDNNISYITQFLAESEFTNVSNPGLTQLVKGQHAWLGETARPNLTLFPGVYSDDFVNKWIAGRISLIGTQEFYWDADTRRTAPYYSAILQYKLGACTVQKNPDPDHPCKVSGSSSISLEYDWGRDKDTYVKTNQFLVKLGFSY